MKNFASFSVFWGGGGRGEMENSGMIRRGPKNPYNTFFLIPLHPPGKIHVPGGERGLYG